MQKLSPTEEELMRVIWAKNSGFIRDFLLEMEDSLPYTTAASIVKNLEKKGFLKSKKMGNTFFYSVKVSQKDYNRHTLSDMVKNYFFNSYKEMVSFFAKEEKISPKELKEIISLIEKKK